MLPLLRLAPRASAPLRRTYHKNVRRRIQAIHPLTRRAFR